MDKFLFVVRVLVSPDMVSRVIQFERLRHMCEGNDFFRLIIEGGRQKG